MTAAKVLEDAGYETIVFHAVGTGGRAMEEMMRQGLIGAVLDYSTIEVSNEMHHALLAGGPDRLTVAGKLGLPQVLCPGAHRGPGLQRAGDRARPTIAGRRLVRHSPQITDVRLTREEMAEVGREVGARLQATREPRGVPDPERPATTATRRPASRSTIRTPTPPSSPNCGRACPRCIQIVERDLDINDPAFATEAAETLIGLMRQKSRGGAEVLAVRYTRDRMPCAPARRDRRGRGLVMTGAGNGIAAKFIERGGVDLIGVYNTGYFRMQGYGSLAGMLPILDANELVFRMAEREVLPQVSDDARRRRRQRRRPAARHAPLPGGSAPDRRLRRPQFSDGRLVRRRVPPDPRSDRARLRARDSPC